MIHSPTLPSVKQSLLLSHYQEQRARYRLLIRHEVRLYKSLYPRRLYRFVPRLISAKWTAIDPGLPDLVYNNLRDDVPFVGLRWDLSGLCKQSKAGFTKHRAITLASLTTEDHAPWVAQIMQGGFANEMATTVRETMSYINSLVNGYRRHQDQFLTLLELAPDLFGPATYTRFGGDYASNPYAGLPEKTGCRKAREPNNSDADNQFMVED